MPTDQKQKDLRKWADARIRAAVKKGAKEGLHHGDIQDLANAAVGRHPTHEDIETYNKALAKSGYEPPRGFKPDRPAPPRPKVDEKAKYKADDINSSAIRKAKEGLRLNDAGEWNKAKSLFQAAADEWDVAADAYEEIGLKQSAGTARQRAEYARAGESSKLRYYAHGLG